VTQVESDFYREIVFLLKTFFFVYLGISMRFSDWSLVAAALALMLLIYSARLLVTPYILPQTISRRDVSVVAVMVPKGLAAAVLAGLPLELEIAGGEIIQTTTYALVLVSITLTAILVTIKDRAPLRQVFDRVLERFPEEVPDDPARMTPLSGIPTVR
jgi:NhaP-type Na+/H+ or K+/H+ antiporter